MPFTSEDVRYNAAGHLSPRQRRRFTRDAAIALVVAALATGLAFYGRRHPVEFQRYPPSPSRVAVDFGFSILIAVFAACFGLMRAWDSLSNAVAVASGALEYRSEINTKGEVQHFLMCGEQQFPVPAARWDAAFDAGVVYRLYYLDTATLLSVERVSPE